MFASRPRPDLEVRILEERHAPIVYRLVDQDRAYLREWMPWVDSTLSEDDTLTFIRDALQRFASKGEFVLGIWQRGSFCGTIGVHKLNRLNHTLEIGYWLGQGFQGRGIMTDTCRMVVDHALSEMEMNRLEIRCAPGNIKSAGVPKRLGFQLEATLSEAQLLFDQYVDLQVWSMLKRNWRTTS